MNIFFILAILTMMAVVAVMFSGVVLMARGGETNTKYSNRLMVWRVMLQGLAIVFILLAVTE